ncbi:MAG: methylenetetrahydrofolate--tRNA-(uracil(54)-C(5))-methyltransferase (FADH(2)-oxidizing) TrmFO [Clostridia bacterium]|nr:methylenetetrahydrofolate--tRNA-(uracil(54)-C(5))-methyltransferase (FADH(2)-oxidizing) TrmFO [Deltaproteobacteria bacterium]
MSDVTIVGAGLAGCEAAWQLARSGARVRLIEMKPLRRTPAQITDSVAELVCSNSLRSSNVQNAVGLIKEEMRRLDSLIIACALETRVPAGDALAVDRMQFAAAIDARLASLPDITRVSEVVTQLPYSGDTVIATGPLTADELASDIVTRLGERMYFYDAIAPIIAGESIDRTIAFNASRWGKGEGDDYVNCPLDRTQYETFVAALLAAECMPLHDFEEPKYFQGCLPIEVVAASGPDTLRYGTMKPVGLDDPRTGRWPYAVVQLRKEDTEGRGYNIVGFQTKMKYPDQLRVFRTIPGLASAEFYRMGAIHRNTYLDSPRVLDERMRARSMPHIRFSGQVTGVEGYVESSAHGLLTGRLVAADLGLKAFVVPPATTALGALFGHVTGAHRIEGRPHEPQNVNWGMVPELGEAVKKSDSKMARVQRAVRDFETWADATGEKLTPRSEDAETVMAGVPQLRKKKQDQYRAT